jgi:hypothetical protein
MRATYAVHFIFLDLPTAILIGEEHKKFLLCNFFRPPVIFHSFPPFRLKYSPWRVLKHLNHQFVFFLKFVDPKQFQTRNQESGGQQM